MEKWFIQAKRADFFGLGKKFHIDPVIARVIRNRDVIGEEAVGRYLHGGLESLHDPHLLKDVDLAVDILLKKKRENKKIRIISDYDVDGVVSNYILWTAFKKCGMDVDFRIPDRITDGYGINERLIAQANDDAIDTIVTCDNGIAAISQIAYAKSLGMTVIVTDHHDIPYDMVEGEKKYLSSNADAIVNPKQIECPYPYDKLCGAVVALKLVQVLYERMGFPEDAYVEFVPFAAIATVCDVVDLTDENRSLVRVGLKMIPNTNNIGLQALLEVNGRMGAKISSYDLGFVIGPCINATGRLDSATMAVNLFLENDVARARAMALKLKELNDSRKAMTEEGMTEAFRMVEEEGLNADDVLVVFLPDCHESLAGIIAGRVREKYYKPAIVLTRSEEMVKGSGRSIEGYHMFEALNEVKDLMTKFGGHPMAAGLSLPEKNVDLFRQKLNEFGKTRLNKDILTRKVPIDVRMPIDYISEPLINQLELLEPFGKANAKPVFAESRLNILSLRRMGKANNMLKLRIQNEHGTVINGVVFQRADEFESLLREKYGDRIIDGLYYGRSGNVLFSAVYYPQINEFRGTKEFQIIINNFMV
ncbi:MAG: single-stranded-DNA-specific exonuclease RecJ [Lachnospiraceae bacterium]|nr:single-stranded-DNA-specific exonuclease RecJ [Lachnospiraceae bacterium]